MKPWLQSPAPAARQNTKNKRKEDLEEIWDK
jgi:hypothetical protein